MAWMVRAGMAARLGAMYCTALQHHGTAAPHDDEDVAVLSTVGPRPAYPPTAETGKVPLLSCVC